MLEIDLDWNHRSSSSSTRHLTPDHKKKRYKKQLESVLNWHHSKILIHSWHILSKIQSKLVDFLPLLSIEYTKEIGWYL